MVKPHQEVAMGKAKLNKKLTSLILILALVATIIPTTNGAAILGGCTVPIVLEVGGKGEGDIVQPTIESWVEGYKETVQIVPDEEGKEEETLKKWYQYAVSSTNRYTQGTGAPTQEHTVDLDPGRGYVKAKYDETGYIGGEKNSWPVGDSVYVVPYYAKISKQVEQTNKDERKSVYTLDNGERYVPSFY